MVIIAIARHRRRIIFNIFTREGYLYKPKQSEQPAARGHKDDRPPMDARAVAYGTAETALPGGNETIEAIETAEIALLLQQGNTARSDEHVETS